MGFGRTAQMIMEIIPGYTLGDARAISPSRTSYAAVSPAGRKVTVEVCRFRRQSLADLAAFKNEMAIIRKTPGGALVAIEDVIYRHDSVVVVYEDYDGVPLGIFFREKPVPVGQALRAGIRIAAALEILHRHGVAHRNLNPLSILVTEGLQSVKLADPGALSLVTRELDDISDQSVIRTRLGYISPEQTGRLMRTPDHRCDFYSLGAVLYELLSGAPPFRSADALETIHAHLANRPLPIYESRPEVPRMVSDIVLKLLAKSPDDRYQTAYGLRVDLEECLNQVAETGMVHQFTAGAYDVPERLVIPQKVYGRGEEIARLMSSFDRVRLGFPELVVVVGPDGVGKSSLVMQLQDAVIRYRGNFMYGKFEEMKRHVPYGAFIQAFQSSLRRILAGSDSETEKWRARLAESLGTGGRVIAEVIPEAGMLLGDVKNLPEVGPEESRNRFNHAFQKFAMLFSGGESSLVLFLDDIHWADPASLALISTLFREGTLKHFMLVATCREAPGETGGWEKLIGFHGDRGVPVREIILGPLSRQEISLMVDESLHCGPGRADALAGILLEKTGGIPINVEQYLTRLVEEGILSCTPGRGWHWDDETVRGMSVADNLAGLLADKIGGLDETVRKILEWAACLGSGFDLEDLSGISGGTVEATHEAVVSALESGLVVKAAGQYRFSHDRIREEVYSRLGDGDRMRMRLKIGYFLLKKTSAGSLEERVFSIVDHLNEGVPLIVEQYDKTDLARLNLIAGIRAKHATAYLSAVRYLDLGMKLLPPGRWNDMYELTLELFHEKMKCEYLSGNFAEAEKLFAEIEASSRTRLDLSRAFNIMIMLYTTTGRHGAAVGLGIRGLRQLGILIPRKPSRARILAGMLAIRSRLSGRKAAEITRLPQMEDEMRRAACEILINMLPPAYYTDARLMAFIVLRMVRLVLRYGNTDASPMIFIAYAGILGPVMKDYDTAHAIAMGAMKLLEGASGSKYRSKVNHVYAMTIHHWKRHARGGIEYSLRAYREGIESGDFMFAGHSVNIMTMTRIMLGDNLDDVFTDYKKYEDFLRRTNDPFVTRNYADNFQMYLNLKGLTESRHSLNSHGYDEQERLAEVRKTGNLLELFFHLLTRARTHFLSGNFDECLSICEEMERIRHIPMGTLHTAEHCFYYSLALAASCHGRPDRRRLRQMRKNRGMMRCWAVACPDNFQHKLYLIDAEIARLAGDDAGAMRLFGMAVEAARSSGYLQNEAIAHERAALFFMERGFREIAGLSLELAFKCYLGWGADSKVYDLRERYASLRDRPGTGGIAARRRQSDLSSMVDTEAMVKALLAISGEIVIEKLLEGLLTILLENAGAERCFLLLEREGRLIVAAEGAPGGEGFRVGQDLPAEMHGGISMSVVNYVKRTAGAVVINDTDNDGLFRGDAVLRGRQVKSLLCAPLVRSKNMTGMIYLENSLTTHAFPPGKIEMVRLLAAQAAIALENAILYEKARNAEQESYSQCQEIQGQYEELEAMYEEMESMNQELGRTSKDLLDANDNLARSEERYRLLAENLTDVIWTTDRKLKFTYISPSIERLAGYTPEEFLSLDLADMMTPESLQRVTEAVAEEIERNKTRGIDPGRYRIIELEQKRKNGSTVWIEVKASFLYDEQGQPSMVLGVSRDITERRKALEKIKNTKNYLDSVLNSLPSMLISVDADGYILQWNSACEECLGVKREEAVLTELWDTVPFMGGYRDIVNGVIEHARPVELHRESVFLEEEKFFDIAMYPLSLAEAGGAVVRIDDVTNRVRIEQVMVQTEKMLSLGGLAAGMAHEINNPLGGIMLGAQNILRRLSGDLDRNREAAEELGITMEQLSRYHEKRGVLKLLEGIVSMGDRASQIVMNMLNFSRHSAVEKTPVNLSELLDQTIELASHDYDLKKKYDFRHIRIVREFATDLPLVPCNRTEIEQVMLNLLKNSAQAMRENAGPGYEPVIVLRLYRRDGHALIEVQDNGPGMDMKTRRRIFEPFFTTKDVGVGTGLGLSVSYYIITSNHRGAISVESEPGNGATFRISLPITPDEKGR